MNRQAQEMEDERVLDGFNVTVALENLRNTTELENLQNTTERPAIEAIECPLVGFLPFTSFGSDLDVYGLNQVTSFPYTHMAAALLAVDHFNERSNAVIPDLFDQTEKCTVILPEPVFSNTDSDVAEVAKFLMDQAYDDVRYCGIVGPWLNNPSHEAANLASGLDIPMVTHGSDDIRITSRFLNPRVASTTVDLHAEAETVISWLREHGRGDFLATVAVTAEYGDQFQETIDNAAKESGFTHISHYTMAPPWNGFDPNRGIGYALQHVKNSGFRNIFLVLNEVFDDVKLGYVADYAEDFGLNNGDYVWVVSSNIDLSALASFASQNANLTKLIRGMAVIKPLDGFIYNPILGKSDPLLDAWQSQNSSFVDRVNALHPIRRPAASGYFQGGEDYFQTHLPENGAGFMYDAVMTQALGRCKQQQTELMEPPAEDSARGSRRVKGERGEPRRRTKKDKGLDPNAHLDAIFATDFEGATGRIAFGEGRTISAGNRQRETLTYGAYNFRESGNETRAINSNYTTWYHVTNVLTGGTVDGTWTTTNDGPFIFANGLASPPPLNRDQPHQNHLSTGVQVTGLVLFCFVAALIIASTMLIVLNRSKAVFRQSQPAFLYMLMLGCLTMVTTIITISFDEEDGWTDSQLDKACLASPWLISLGYNCMYCALFSKLWRINQVLQFRRRKVEVRQAMGPFFFIVLANIVVLILWAALDPFTWNRREIDFDTGESYGRCNSEYSTIFVSTLAAMMAISTGLCAVMAWKTKDVDSRFSESKWIFYTILFRFKCFSWGFRSWPF